MQIPKMWRSELALLESLFAAQRAVNQRHPVGDPMFELAHSSRQELDLETLVRRGGRGLSIVAARNPIEAPSCGSRKIAVMFEPPVKTAMD
jgi:hypothetical protein